MVNQFWKNINHQTKRNIALASVGFLGVSQVFFLKPIFQNWLNFSLIGSIDVATVIGSITAISAYLMYKSRL